MLGWWTRSPNWNGWIESSTTPPAGLAELLVLARLERDHQRDVGQDTAWLDRVFGELEPLAEQSHDLETAVAIRHVAERRGPGPYRRKTSRRSSSSMWRACSGR